MKFKISIEIDNDAFQPDPRQELCRILRDLIDTLESDGWAGPYSLRDINGNKVGQAGSSSR